MKKITSIILLFLFVLSVLSACGQKPATTQDSTAKEGSKDQPVTIYYYSWRLSAPKYPDEMIAAFTKKYPNIKVVFSGGGVPVEQYLNTQKVKLLSGDNIDVTSIRTETRADYVKAGYLQELTGGEPFLANFNSSVLDGIKVDGKLYSIPSGMNIIGVYYNKDLFKKLSLNIPTNWDEFITVLDKIKASGITPLMNGGKDGWPMEFDVYTFIHNVLVKNPDIFTKIDKGEAKYTDPIFVDAFKKISDFYKKGYIAKETLSLGYDGANTIFMQGKTAMLVQGEWDMGQFAGKDADGNDIKVPFEIGVFPLPYNKAGEDIVVPISIGATEAVVTSSKHKDAAMKFLEFMATPEGASYIATGLSTFSPVKGAPTDFHPLAPLWKPLLDMKSTEFFYSLQFPAANAEMLKQLQIMFLGKTTPEDALNAIQGAQMKKSK